MTSQQRVQLIQALNAAEANPSSIPPAPASTIADDYEIMNEEDIASDPPTDASDANNEEGKEDTNEGTNESSGGGEASGSSSNQ
jgi:hypothetical protein